MDLSGFAEHLAAIADEASLEIPIGGRTYTVRPPTTEVGARCAALWAARTADAEAWRSVYGEVIPEGMTLPQLTLGADVVEQMTADGVPGLLVQEAGMVALITWAVGPDAAQAYIDQQVEKQAQRGDGAGKVPRRSPSRKRTGTSTGSASRTR